MTVSQPRVTVGMPVYNDPDGLRRSVPSILNQTWPGAIRLLVLDDGSTDETPAVLAALAADHDTVEVVRAPHNEGRPFARNRILDLAGDDYLAWCDSGDLWHPRKLELQLAALIEAERQDQEARLLCTGSVHWVDGDTGETRVRVPAVAGDQLRNALLGTLYPYLQGILGRASHFRAIGGFDQRLLRRQDYDFLVRFLGAGGRLVSAPEHVPVFTYVKSYADRSAAVVVRSNRTIRAAHRPYYRQYGATLTRRVWANQHRLVARFYESNGHTMRSRSYRLLAWLCRPEVVAPTRRTVRRVVHAPRLAGAGASRLVALLRPLLPPSAWRRLLSLAHRAGLDRTQVASRARRRLAVQSRTQLTRASSAPPALAPGLELTPGGWLDLERAYREHGLLHSAETALRRGMDQHPDNPDLAARLIELLPLRRDWAGCVELWNRWRAENQSFRALTYTRVARALRQLDRPAEALVLAQEGVERWAGYEHLRAELYLSRAELVDWSQALVQQPLDDSPADCPESIGVVTDLGCLAGGDDPIEGRVAVPGPTAPRISLTVNGTPVVSTFATRSAASGDQPATFALSCADLRSFLGDGDVVTVVSDGRPLTIMNRGTARVVRTGYESRFPELRRKLAAGYVFTKFGQLKMGPTAQSKAAVLALYDEIAAILTEAKGYPAFPFYGNLLGAIREHDIISHDAGGFDMGYVSSHHEPDKVREEFAEICRTLLDRGFHLRVEPWSVYVRSSRSSRVFVDVNYAWFTAEGELNFSFGWRYPPITDREKFFEYRESLIGKHPVRVPGNAEQVLEQLYGPTWAVPDQGYGLDVGLQRRSEFLLTAAEMASLERLDADRVEARYEHHPDNNHLEPDE